MEVQLSGAGWGAILCKCIFHEWLTQIDMPPNCETAGGRKHNQNITVNISSPCGIGVSECEWVQGS